ncbi:MAG: CapA family protein [Sphingobacteriaceae bacterium]
MKRLFFLLYVLLVPFQILLAHPDTLRIVAVGDIMMGSAFPSPILPPDDGKGSFKAVLPLLRTADLTFGNLEGVFLDEGQSDKCKNSKACYAFRMPERYVSHLQDAGFDVLSVANNHSGDFNELGRSQTAKTLSDAGIQFAGFQSHPYTVYVKNGVKYAICAFAPNEGTASLHDWAAAKKRIAELKKLSDIVVVYFHGGGEGSKFQHINRTNEYFYGENRGNAYAFARMAIDAGADVVLGSGPHVTRAVDLYKNRFIAYSLGNFCTYGMFNLDGPNGVAPLLALNINEKGEFISAKVTSIVQQETMHLRIDTSGKAFQLLKELTQSDIPETKLQFSADGTISKKPLKN